MVGTVTLLTIIVVIVGGSKSDGAGSANSTQTAALPSANEPPRHLTFRGLQAGQSRAEVEAILKKQDESTSLHCEDDKNEDNKSGVSCDGNGRHVNSMDLAFSREDKLTFFYFRIHSPNLYQDVDHPDDFFPPLRKELATANFKEGEKEDELTAHVQAFAWGTDQTVVCPMNQEKDDCPAEKIELKEFDQPCCFAKITLIDNSSITKGWAKKDENRPQPKVARAISFMGLEGGEPRTQVDAALQQLGYPPLACNENGTEGGLDCTTRFEPHRFEFKFVGDRLLIVTFYYPAKEHETLYQNFVQNLGPPTDFVGKKGTEIFVWESERTVNPFGKGQAAADTLILDPTHEGDPSGSVSLTSLR